MTHSLSVIIPTFNTGSYLAKCLGSLVMQISPRLNLDIVVVDDGSTDNTEAVASSFAPHIQYHRIGHTGRPGTVRNHGLRLASGEFVAFLDSDDTSLPGGLERLVGAVSREADVGFAYANYYIREGDTSYPAYQRESPSGWIFDELFRANFIRTSAVVAERRLVEECRGFFPHTETAEDYWLWLQLAKRARGVYLPDAVAEVSARADSASGRPVVEKLPDLIQVVLAIAEEFQVPRPLVLERVNPLRLWLAKELLRVGRPWAASVYATQALVAQPGLLSSWAFLRSEKALPRKGAR